MNLYKDNRKLQMGIRFVDRQFWDILEFDILDGRLFNQQEVDEAKQVAVVSKNFSKQYFNNELALGEIVDIDGINYRIIGVVDDVSVTRHRAFSDVWLPVSTSKEDFTQQSFHGNYRAMVLAYSKSDIETIKAEFLSHLKQVEFPNPDRYDKIDVLFMTIMESFTSVGGDFEVSLSRTMFIVIGIMILFMLLPTINLVNINITRIMERSSEIGIRKAFGATKRTLIAQFVTENLILTTLGALIALALTWLFIIVLNQSGFSPIGTGSIELSFNLRVFFYAITTALLFGLFSGVLPALRMAKLHPVESLKGAK